MTPHHSTSIKYRPDIDGLRAVAVLPVIFYHFGVPPFSGGYVGVDIFFVISGYLIGKIILDELAAERYSIAQFYVRRIGRIFPALFLALLATLLGAWLFLFPDELEEFGNNVVAVTFFVSNLFFYATSGYFAAAAESKPLLHTWSLAVEEQFYIFFPLILIALQRFRPGKFVLPIALMALASFALSTWQIFSDRDAAFYLVHTRAWELLAGALLAAGAFRAPNRKWAELFGVVGLALIFAAVFLFDSRTLFPGPSALLPVVGAALLIHAGSCAEQSHVSRLLATRPLVRIGLISYSLYLWHWPLIVFYRFYDISISATETCLLILACFALATLSWRYVEEPFRKGGFKLPRAKVFMRAGVAMAAFVLMGGLFVWSEGAAWRFPAPVVQLAAYASYDSGQATRRGRCFLTSTHADFRSFDRDVCLAIDPRKKNYLLVGDSHGAHLWSGLQRVYADHNFLQATSSGCKPVRNAQGEDRCKTLMRFVYEDFVPKHRLDAILISARWRPEDVPALMKTVEYLKAHADVVYVFGPITEYEDRLPRLLARDMLIGQTAHVDSGRSVEQLQTDRVLAEKLSEAGVRYISTYRTLCVRGHCATLDEAGAPLQFDYGHLTEQGSFMVAKRWKQGGVFP